jgi:hypothetical protein
MDLSGAFHKLTLIADIEIADQTPCYACLNRRGTPPQKRIDAMKKAVEVTESRYALADIREAMVR